VLCCCTLAEVQRRAAPILNSGLDAVIISKTGSGKTFAFMAPMLAQLAYPPEMFPEDLKGPQVPPPTLACCTSCLHFPARPERQPMARSLWS
jgi:superfamily II DNA/RNA helicase